MQTIVGLDIGYSNLKLAVGQADQPASVSILPGGAAPSSHYCKPVTAEGSSVTTVLVDDKRWVAGVSPSALDGFRRTLHADYPSQATYRALVEAGLTLAGRSVIDRLVTGLPVDEAADPTRRQALQRRLQGTHLLANNDRVEVRTVTVLAQPVGAFLDYVARCSEEDLARAQQGRVLVIDAGFYSLDWTLIEAGRVRDSSSGTSTLAMSALLERAEKHLRGAGRGSVGIERLEDAARSDGRFLLGGQWFRLADVVAEIAPAFLDGALSEMRERLRQDSRSLDAVVVAGGGARTYESIARRIGGRDVVRLAPEPVAANARGFFAFGARLAHIQAGQSEIRRVS